MGMLVYMFKRDMCGFRCCGTKRKRTRIDVGYVEI